MRKETIALLTSVIIAGCCALPAYASEAAFHMINHEVVTVREDVPHDQAITDPSYSESLADGSSVTDIVMTADDIYWKVWGDMIWENHSDAVGARPVGYSEHRNGDEILDTFHYTRTYLGWDKSGDSGRVWGTGTVKAVGSFCDRGVWETSIHYVKYGTTSD